MTGFSALVCAWVGFMCGDPQQVLVQKQLDVASTNLSRQSAESLLSTYPMTINWMRRPENRWKVGEFPVLDVYQNPTNPDQVFRPEPGLRIAIDQKITEAVQTHEIGQDRARLNIWFDPTGGIDPLSGNPYGADAMAEMARKTTSPGAILQALLDAYQGGSDRQRMAIGMARNGVLAEQHTSRTFRLPSAVLSRPVGAESLMISMRTGGLNGCGILPDASDPNASAPATEPAARRWHFDAWSVTTACVPAGWRQRQQGMFHGAPAWVAVQVFNKTQELRGCNVVDAFVPTYEQLADPVIFAGLTLPASKIPTGAPLNAPATNPSTYLVEDCGTNAVPPPVVNPPPTTWTETKSGSCPAGWSGSQTLARTGTKIWIVSQVDGTFPPETYTPWAVVSDTCTPPPPPPPPPPIVDPVVDPVVDPCSGCNTTTTPSPTETVTTAGATPPAPPKVWYTVSFGFGGGDNNEGHWGIVQVDEAFVKARTEMGFGYQFTTNPDTLLTDGSQGYTPPEGVNQPGGDNGGWSGGGGGDGGNGGGGVGGGGGGYSGGGGW